LIRWLFFLLIIVNLVIFLWGTQRDGDHRSGPPEPKYDVPPVLLLGEQVPEARPAPELESEADSRAPGAPVPSPGPAGNGQNRPRDEGRSQDRKASGRSLEPISENRAKETGSLDPGQADGSPSARADVWEPPAEPTLAQQTSLAATEAIREMLETQASDSSEPAKDPPTAKSEHDAIDGEIGLAARCYTIGPFSARADAEEVLATLDPGDAAASLRQKNSTKQIGYWVLIEQQKSRDEAIIKVAGLKTAGFSDVWRFNKGRLTNAISLGLFVGAEQAERHRSQVASKGFPAKVEPRFVEESAYWIDVDGLGEEVSEDRLMSLTDSYEEVAVLPRDCP
jgi:hypothetical protein